MKSRSCRGLPKVICQHAGCAKRFLWVNSTSNVYKPRLRIYLPLDNFKSIRSLQKIYIVIEVTIAKKVLSAATHAIVNMKCFCNIVHKTLKQCYAAHIISSCQAKITILSPGY